MPKYVPFELQIKIMKGLSIKSLIKFRSVSKTWKSFIDSPKFIADYNNHHTHHHDQIILYNPKRLYIINDDDHDSSSSNKDILELPVKLHSSHMIGYSQGLLGFYYFNNSTGDFVAVIWNPSIRKSIDIPIPNALGWPCGTVFGFGVCNATDPMIVKINYIVKREIESTSSIPSQVEVYKLSTGKWISLSDTACLPRKSLEFFPEVVVTEGFIYWLVYDRDAMFYMNEVILSFDMNNEKFSEICIPHSLANTPGWLELSKVGESLVVVEVHHYTDVTESSVWMMVMEDGGQNSFKKLYTIKAPRESIKKVLGFRKNGEPIIHTRSASNKHNILVVYEPDSQPFQDSWVPVIDYYDLKCSYVYTDTLLLLDH